MPYCQNCGTELINDAKYCAKCGKEVNVTKSKKGKSNFILRIFTGIGGISLLVLLIILILNVTKDNKNSSVNTSTSKNENKKMSNQPALQTESKSMQKDVNTGKSLEGLAKEAFSQYLEQIFYKKHDRTSESVDDDTKFRFGDINSDGKLDAVAIYSYSYYPSANAWTQALAVFINQDDIKFDFLSDVETGSRQSKLIDFNSDILINKQEISCTESYWTEGDPGCCPSGKRNIKYIIAAQGIYSTD